MKRKNLLALFLCLTFIFTGCGSSDSSETTTEDTTTATTTENGHATTCTVTLIEGKYSEEKLDSSWDASTAVSIDLSSLTVSDEKKVSVSENSITITQAGTYVASGELSDGRLIIDVPNKGDVKLVLNQASITSSNSSALHVKEGNTIIVLADGTENTFIDSENYTFEDGEDEPDATIFAKDDLTFNGTGTLIVQANYKDAIKCKDDLKFVSGSFDITSVDDGIVGKDSVSVRDGSFQINSEGDALKATNTEETDKGYVMIDGGSFQITSTKDAIVAETLLRVNSGTINIVSGTLSAESSTSGFGGASQPNDINMMDSQPGNPGGMPSGDRGGRVGMGDPGSMDPGSMEPGNSMESSSSENTVSAKGLKSYVELVVAGGTFSITAEDDAIHSDQNATIDDGTLSVASGDDGLHAEKLLTINGGTLDVTQSYEGIEAFDIVINDGNVTVNASDDGINAAGDADSATNPEDDETTNTDNSEVQDNFSNFPGAGGMMEAEDQGATLTINGGNVTLLASGDVIDINGDGVINGGTVIAQGPTSGGNGTLDYASSFDIKGGTFWGIGTAQMAMNPSSSAYGLICGTVQETISQGTTITVADSSGNTVAELEVQMQGQWLAVTSPEIEKGSSYTLTIGTSVYSATAS